MTEQEWLECDDPAQMLKRARFRSYRRKSRLFAVACCRRIWQSLVDERSRAAVEVAERYADGGAADEELRLAAEAARQAHREMFDTVGKVGSCIEWAAAYAADPNPFHGARNVTWMAATPRVFEVRRARPSDWNEFRHLPCTVTPRAGPQASPRERWQVITLAKARPTGAESNVQAALLRDIFGPLPFRPVTVSAAWLAWNEGTVRRLAEAIYAERAFERLGVLADALEGAGCDDTDILAHCRGPELHARGCFVLDVLLGKA